MKILHLTPNTNGYEEAVLIHSRISDTNHMALIEVDGKEYMTGGFLLIDNGFNRTLLDDTPPDFQYDLIRSLREKPHVK